MLILHAPLEIGVAVVFGFLWGVLITYLPAQPRPSPFIRKVCTTHNSVSTSESNDCLQVGVTAAGGFAGHVW